MLSKGLAAYLCGKCGHYFFLRVGTADKIISLGKQMKCRECMLTPFPFPYARRLTDDELKDHDWEVYCQEQNIANLKEATDHLMPVSSISLPTPTMAKRQKSPREEQIRQNLKNSLLATGVTVWKFGQAAGFGANAKTTVQRFIDGSGKRATFQSVLRKIEKEMGKRGWLQQPEGPADAAKVLDDFRKTPTDLFDSPKASKQETSPSNQLTPSERFHVIHAVLSLQGHHDGYKILGKLFPNS